MKSTETLKLKIANQDRSDDLGREIAATEKSLEDSGFDDRVAKENEILSLHEAENEDDYLLRHIDLLRSRTSVDPSLLRISSSPGFLGRIMWLLRSLLWKLIRYQIDWSCFHQNKINAQLADELEFEVKSRMKHNVDIERRLKVLEQKAEVSD